MSPRVLKEPDWGKFRWARKRQAEGQGKFSQNRCTCGQRPWVKAVPSFDPKQQNRKGCGRLDMEEVVCHRILDTPPINSCMQDIYHYSTNNA